MKALKILALVTGVAALALLAYAGWLVIPQVLLLSRTKAISAEAVNKDDPEGKLRIQRRGLALLPELLRDHDSSGYATYALRLTFVYFLDGKRHVATADTPYWTRDVASIIGVRTKYEEGTTHEIRYDPSNPDHIYFESGMPERLWEPALWSVLGALALAGCSVILLRLARPLPLCASCGQMELERFYKFCPGCAAPVAKKAQQAALK